MANWSNPLLTSTYTNFLTEVKDRDTDLALQFDGTTSTNIPTNTIRWNSSINRWQKWSGSAWGELTTTYALTALTTTTTVTATGNVSGAALVPSSATIPVAGIFLPAANTLAFATATTERLRIDSSGRLLVGTSAARTIASVAGSLQLETTGAVAGSQVSTVLNRNTDASGPRLLLARTRGTANGQFTAVIADDQLGNIRWHGADGTSLDSYAAEITVNVDGTPGLNDMPGRLVFSTTADGASSPTERLRITNDGVQAYNQPAPAAVNATATLTVANLKAGIITSTSAAATDMTLPTGTDTQAGFSGTYDNMTFEWSVINTGPSLVRVLAGTAHTVVGSGSVATGTSGRFASRRTAANTFVTYRLT